MRLFYLLALIMAGSILASCGGKSNNDQITDPVTEEDLMEKARGIHERVITLDTHCDINTRNFTSEQNYTQDLPTQVTLPKMEEGGLDVAWFIVYTGQQETTEEGYAAAYENAIDKFNAIHRLCEEIAPDRIGMATSSADVERIAGEGKKVAMIGIENAFPLAEDLSRIQEFYDLGGRYMSLAHNGHNQLSDSHTGEEDSVWLHNGLSDLGKEAIAEMNRVGIMIDISHPSREAMKQMLELTKAPIIASHSSARALSDHSRNLDDEQLKWMKENGGVIQTVALDTYVNIRKQETYEENVNKLYTSIADTMGFEILPRREVYRLSDADRNAYNEKYDKVRAIAEEQLPSIESETPPVDVSDFVDHIDYMVNLIGIDHVGISSDFDGGGGVRGWNDASETFNLTLELVKRGYSEEEIAKIWSGNLLRVLDEVQEVARKIQQGEL